MNRGRAFRIVRRALAGVFILLVLLAPVALAVAAPSLAEVPASRPAPPRFAPLPATNTSTSTTTTTTTGAASALDGLLDPFPMVARQLPDEISRRAVSAFDRATLGTPDLLAAMYLDAWYGIILASDPADHEAINQLANDLADPSDDPEAIGTTGQATMALLARDPRHADRLNNVAVALLGLAAAIDYTNTESGMFDYTSPEHGDWHFGYFVLLANSGFWLLDQIGQHFPPNRAAVLNRAYLQSVSFEQSPENTRQATQLAGDWLAVNPDDRTARLLLASLLSRDPFAPDGLDRAVQTLEPLTENPATAALGQAALGDAYLAAATLRRPAAPYQSQQLAEQALHAYDQALGATGDPGLFAGRARALALLDAIPEAVASQREAVSRATGSIGLRLTLAALQEQAGDFEGMRATAREALALAPTGWAPRLLGLRFVTMLPLMTPGDRGFLGYSIGSERDHAEFLPNALQGGVFIVALDVVPRTDDDIFDSTHDDWRLARSGPAVAREYAVAGSIIRGEPDAARADGASREQVLAATLVAGHALPADSSTADLLPGALRTAQNTLRHAGRFAEAAQLCQRVAQAAGAADGTTVDVVRPLACQGEASYLAGDFDTAATALRQAYELALDSPLGKDVAKLRLEAAGAAQAAGQPEAARELYALAAIRSDGATDSDGVPATRLVALSKLGEMALDAGDPSRAIGYYDLLLAGLDGSAAATDELDARTLPQVEALTARARSNRGVARLWLAQPRPERSPACGGAGQASCQAARQDFEAALAIDPRNPFYRLNLAWAARLLGDPASAREHLAVSVEVDPTSFAALNDLGVLAAKAGDAAEARRAFRDALAVNPDYELAAWNLGVLELERGLTGIPRGQALLARAIRQSSSLRDEPLEYIEDERVYRVTLGPNSRPRQSAAVGQNYSRAAIALGSIVLLAAGGQALGAQIRGKVIAKAVDEVESRVPRVGAWLLAHSGPLGRLASRVTVPRDLVPWLVTLPALAIATVVPIRQAAQEATPTLVALALFATVIALVAHELGHLALRCWLGGEVRPAQWGTGVAMSLLVLPIQVTTGPFLGHRVSHASSQRAWWIALGGPAANLLVAVAAFGLSLVEPMPLFRLIAQVQLAAVGFSLMPVEPMDGPTLKKRPFVFSLLGLLVACVGLVIAQGRL